MSGWKSGDVIEVDYPFVRTTFTRYDEGGGWGVLSWRPGVEYVVVGPEGDAAAVFDAMGKQILTVIDAHRPGKYPTRVFYTVTWVSPDGNRFGKGGLKITTSAAFTRRTRGFMAHDLHFEMHIRPDLVTGNEGAGA